jgi:citrate synthase
MKKMCKRLCDSLGDTKWYEIAEAVENVMKREMQKKSKQVVTNVDFWSAVAYYYMKIPIEVYTPIFAAARIVGWCSHIIEQLDPKNPIIRPKAIYVGPTDLQYIPIRKR